MYFLHPYEWIKLHIRYKYQYYNAYASCQHNIYTVTSEHDFKKQIERHE